MVEGNPWASRCREDPIWRECDSSAEGPLTGLRRDLVCREARLSGINDAGGAKGEKLDSLQRRSQARGKGWLLAASSC